jgi:hypothetical protein
MEQSAPSCQYIYETKTKQNQFSIWDENILQRLEGDMYM